MSIHKLNKLVKNHNLSVLFLFLILISHFITPTIFWSEIDNLSPTSLLFLTNITEDEVSLIIGNSHKFRSNSLNGNAFENEKETKLIIVQNAFYDRIKLKKRLALNQFVSPLDLPNLLSIIPRSPPQVLS